MKQIGYFGVIVPEYAFWQGYFLIEELLPAGTVWLDQVRGMLKRYSPPSAVMRPMKDVPEDKQELIGAISASIMEFALTSAYDQIGTAATGMHILTGFKYFLIVGHREKGGSRTEVVNYPDITSADEFRAMMDAHPLVMTGKLTVAKEAVERAKKGKPIH